ncbi:MAG TPA: hypothetical protein VHW23_41420 [Kofleriaceae bacterium]|nr:hypothetical protein [Kofleriaceae bacterium]
MADACSAISSPSPARRRSQSIVGGWPAVERAKLTWLTQTFRSAFDQLAGAATSADRPYGKLLLPLIAAIAWARARGVPTFDVGGLPAPGDPDPKRAAIARFKAMFAPEPVALVAPHRRWLWW